MRKKSCRNCVKLKMKLSDVKNGMPRNGRLQKFFILGLLTVSFDILFSNLGGTQIVYANVITVDPSASIEDGSVTDVNAIASNEKLVKRYVDPCCDYNVQSSNDISTDRKLDSEHLRLFRNRGPNSSHRHPDGSVYYFKGYKCVPYQETPADIRQSTKKPGKVRESSARNAIDAMKIYCEL
jgi:hypothetical protein